MSARADRLAADLKLDTLTGMPRVLAEEACRIVTRLDRLHEQLEGDPGAWFGIIETLPDTIAEVTVDKALAEARQQATTLTGVLTRLAALLGEAPAVPVASPADEIRAARERRKEEAARKAAQAQG